MSREPFTTHPARGFASQRLTFNNIVPSIEADGPITTSSPRSTPRTPSASDSDNTDSPIFTPTRSIASSSTYAALSPRGRLTPGRSTSTYADLYNATPEPAASQRATSRRNETDTTARNNNILANHPLAGNSHSDPEGENENENVGSVDERVEDETDWEGNSPYNMRGEQLPGAPIYNTELQSILRSVKSQLSALHQDMGKYSLSSQDGSDLHDLCQKVHELSKYDYPETRTVGFIGDSGVGKSAVINSLLNQQGLARSSGDGAACTCVVTEFRSVDAEHPNPYTIEVDYMDGNEMQELLEELLQKFRLLYTDAFQEVQGAKEQQEVRDSAMRAWSTFESLFRGYPDLTQDFLADKSDGAQARILDQLKEWATDSFRTRPGGSALHYKMDSNDLAHYRNQLEALTMNPDGNEMAVWPFIKLIRVYVRSPVLRTGLVLADMPGFRDLNYARVMATEKYLKNCCDEVFVVTTISRCLSDVSIEDIKARLDQTQPFRIVCTRSEDVNATEMSRDYPTSRDRIIQLQNRVSDTEKRFSRARALRNPQTIPILLDELEDSRFALQRFLMLIRNEKITAGLVAKYPTARIFCVSNTMYTDYCENLHRLAETYIELSGVRGLRRYCQLVPAEAQFRSVAGFLEHRVPALVRSVKQWALAGSDSVEAGRQEDLRRTLSDVERAFREELILRDSELRKFPTRLEEHFRSAILNVSEERRVRWASKAVQASQEWRGWHHATYAAFCRNHGTYCTPAVGNHCWNSEIIEKMGTELDGRWYALDQWIVLRKNTLRGAVNATFEKVSNSLDEKIELAPIALGNFVDNLDSWEECTLENINRSVEKLLQGTSRIQRDALQGHDSSYIARLMRPIYGLCNQESGRGSDARRKQHMHNGLTNSDLFAQHIGVVSRDYRDLIKEVSDDLKRLTEEEVANITRDLRTIIAEEGQEMTEAGRFPELATLLRRKADAAQGVLEDAQRIVNRLKSA